MTPCRKWKTATEIKQILKEKKYLYKKASINIFSHRINKNSLKVNASSATAAELHVNNGSKQVRQEFTNLQNI